MGGNLVFTQSFSVLLNILFKKYTNIVESFHSKEKKDLWEYLGIIPSELGLVNELLGI
jgi:hypothetical protein